MNAIFYQQYGAPSVLEYGDQPIPNPGAKEVLIKVHASALNPIDCEVRKGSFKVVTGKRFPRIPGCDFAGEIIAKGAKVKPFKVGDLIYGMSKTYRGGAHAEYITMNPSEIGLKPPSLSMVEAAALPLASLTSLQALRDLAQLQAGQKILLNGASGGVGVFAIQLAKAMGAIVHAICSHRNIELVKSLGADLVIDYTQTNIRSSKERYDVIYDIYGSQSFPRVKHLLSSHGRHVSTIPSAKNFRRQYIRRFFKRTTQVILVVSNTQDLDALSSYIEEGKLRPIIDRVLPLHEAAQAQTYLETRRAKGKVVLQIEKE
ncbi:MAG: NAD(P)-dependent alcohol dehydrogenase [Bacteroidota bacterium]